MQRSIPRLFMPVAIVAAVLPVVAQAAPGADRKGAAMSRAVAFVGYGTRVVPKVPFEVGRLSRDADDLVFVHHSAPSRKVLLAPSEKGMGMKIGPGTAAPEEVFAEIGEVTKTRGWRVEFASYSIPLLPGLSAWSTKDGTKWTVELTVEGGKDEDEMIYVEGPFAKGKAPQLDALVAKDMTIATTTKESVEATYTVGDAPWRQRRQLVALKPDGLLLITAQASDVRAAQVFSLADELAREVRAAPH